jgi:biopolymer transport protein ExbB
MLEPILDGGFMMIPLIALSVLALAVIIDRVRAYRVASVDTDALRERVIDLLQADKVDEAIAACRRFGGPVAAVLMVGLHKFGRLRQRSRSTAEIEGNVTRTMSDYAPHVVEALERRLNLLTLIGTISPLLGMTGTVLGMIRSFGVLGEMGVLEGGAVAGGIAEALVTTAAGLLIAIPAFIAHNLFSRQVDRYVLQIEESATELIDFITLERARE